MQLLNTGSFTADFSHVTHLVHGWEVQGARRDEGVAFSGHEDAVDVEEATGLTLNLALDTLGLLKILLQVVSVQVGCNGRRLQFRQQLRVLAVDALSLLLLFDEVQGARLRLGQICVH